ncbi:Hypothetical predicted protein, partial [Olea europaea subsp. europaea]
RARKTIAVMQKTELRTCTVAVLCAPARMHLKLGPLPPRARWITHGRCLAPGHGICLNDYNHNLPSRAPVGARSLSSRLHSSHDRCKWRQSIKRRGVTLGNNRRRCLPRRRPDDSEVGLNTAISRAFLEGNKLFP